MKVRFQADADLDARIVRGVRRRQPLIDFQTAAEGGLRGLPDPEVLQIAADSGRVLVTHDRRSMPHHFREFISARTSPGVIVIPWNNSWAGKSPAGKKSVQYRRDSTSTDSAFGSCRERGVLVASDLDLLTLPRRARKFWQ